MPLDKEDHKLLDDVVRSLTDATKRLEKWQDNLQRLAATVTFLAGRVDGLKERLDKLESYEKPLEEEHDDDREDPEAF